MTKKFRNRRKEKFLRDISRFPSLYDASCDIPKRCKFNFSYFDSSQIAGQDFSDWTKEQIVNLLNSLKEYCKKTIFQLCDGGRPLVIYRSFPKVSDFIHPNNVPHQAQWGRFKLGGKVRLVGFTIPGELHNTRHEGTGELFDKNTFYVVFLDKDHKFYITEKP